MEVSAEKVSSTLKVLKSALERFGADNIAVSFNGGKDACVLLHLLQQVLQSHTNAQPKGILCIYFEHEDHFPEAEEFVERCKADFSLTLVRLPMPYHEGLRLLLEKHPNISAVLMGTRRTDPYAENLNPFSPCTPPYPPLCRVLPLLEWTYSEIWAYILTHGVRYCKLYDMGYSSLGLRGKTSPNPALVDENGTCHPAYLLLEEHTERHGRTCNLSAEANSL